MSRTDSLNINAKTISVNQVPIAGSPAPVGPWTTFDQLDADIVLALNGVVIQGTPYPGMIYTNFDNVNVLSGIGHDNTVDYGTPSTPVTNAATGPLDAAAGAYVPPTLAALTVANPSATVGTAYSSTVIGKTAGSMLSLSGAGSAGLSVFGITISGTPLNSGPVNIIETLSGATFNPRTTTGVITVSGSDIPSSISAPPTLTRTSAINVTPLTFDIGYPADVYPGYRLHVQMSATTDFSGTLQYDGQYVIQSEDLEAGATWDLTNALPPFDYNLAAGPHKIRAQFESDIPLASGWSNTMDATLLSGVVAEGDSITANTGSYANRSAGFNPTIITPFSNQSVGGNGLNDVVTRKSTTLSKNPAVFTILIGANDLIAYPDGASYYAAIKTQLTDDIRATGCKIVICSILPQATSYSAGHNAKAIQFNNAVAADVGVGVDYFVDWRTSVMWTPDGNTAATNTRYYADGLHPTDGTGSAINNGHAQLEPEYTYTVRNALGMPLSNISQLADKYVGVTLSNNNLTMTGQTGAPYSNLQPAKSNRAKIVGGRYGATGYFEVLAVDDASSGTGVCLVTPERNLNNPSSSSRIPGGDVDTGITWYQFGGFLQLGAQTSAPSWGAGDVLGVYYDAAQQKVWFSKNGTWIAETGSPSSGAGKLVQTGGEFYAGGFVHTNNSLTFRFKASDQQYRGSLQAWEL